jgi:hypothetical protein
VFFELFQDSDVQKITFVAEVSEFSSYSSEQAAMAIPSFNRNSNPNSNQRQSFILLIPQSPNGQIPLLIPLNPFNTHNRDTSTLFNRQPSLNRQEDSMPTASTSQILGNDEVFNPPSNNSPSQVETQRDSSPGIIVDDLDTEAPPDIPLLLSSILLTEALSGSEVAMNIIERIVSRANNSLQENDSNTSNELDDIPPLEDDGNSYMDIESFHDDDDADIPESREENGNAIDGLYEYFFGENPDNENQPDEMEDVE